MKAFAWLVVFTSIAPHLAAADAQVPAAEDQIFRAFFGLVARGDTSQAISMIAPENVTPESSQTLSELAAHLRGKEVTEIEPLGFQVFQFGPTHRGNLYTGKREPDTPGFKKTIVRYQIRFADGVRAFAEMMVRDSGTKQEVVKFYAVPIAPNAEELHAFTLWDRPAQDYLVFLMAIAELLLMLGALIACLSAKGMRRKWLWTPFILIGVGSLTINWTTGEMAFSLLRAQILGVGYARQYDFVPWMVRVSFPLGAILFLLKWKLRSAKSDISIPAPVA